MINLNKITERIRELDVWDLIVFCWMLTLLSSSIGRYMNYSYTITLGAFFVYFIRRRQININYLNILWGAFILVYPLLNYIIHTPQFFLIDIFGYVISFIGLLAIIEPVRRFECIVFYIKMRALIEAFFVILQQLAYPIYVKFAWRILGTWNYDAGGMALNISLSAYIIAFGIGAFLFIKNNKHSVFRVSAIIFCFIALTFTDKRTLMIVTLLLSILIYFINCDKKTRAYRLLLVPFLLTAAIGIGIWLYKTYGNENAIGRIIETLIGISQQKDVSNSRSDIQAVAWNLWEESARTRWFGIGWGNFKHNFTLFKNTSQAHNIYIQLLCETGMIGLTCFVFVQGVSLISALRLFIRNFYETGSRRNLLGVSIFGQLVFGIYGITGNPLYDSTCYLMYFLMITLFIAVRRSYRLEKRQ